MLSRERVRRLASFLRDNNAATKARRVPFANATLAKLLGGLPVSRSVLVEANAIVDALPEPRVLTPDEEAEEKRAIAAAIREGAARLGLGDSTMAALEKLLARAGCPPPGAIRVQASASRGARR